MFQLEFTPRPEKGEGPPLEKLGSAPQLVCNQRLSFLELRSANGVLGTAMDQMVLGQLTIWVLKA